MVNESLAGNKFDPVMVYVFSEEFVLIRTFPNDSDAGVTVRADVDPEIPVPVTETVLVVPPPVHEIVPL
jgi:hypothetical protein